MISKLDLLLEIVRILRPGLLLQQCLLLCGIVLVVCIALGVLNVVLQLPTLLSACLAGHHRLYKEVAVSSDTLISHRAHLNS